MNPVVKWPGGKRFLAVTLAPLFEEAQAKRYVEPFAGGAALFFRLAPTSALLADSNEELINLYKVIRDNVDHLIDELQSYGNSKREYYARRSSRPRSQLRRAARMYYLQRLSFNGIYRENRNGEFNVPYGYKATTAPFDVGALQDAHVLLRDVDLRCQDFRQTFSDVKKGDFVYADPPYTVAHNNNGFIKYNSQLFSWADQLALSEAAKKGVLRGATILVSNANHRSLRRLYRDFSFTTIHRTSRIAADPTFRGRIAEGLYLSKGLNKCRRGKPR